MVGGSDDLAPRLVLFVWRGAGPIADRHAVLMPRVAAIVPVVITGIIARSPI